MGIRTIAYQNRRANGEKPSTAYPGALEDSRRYNKYARRRAVAGAILAAAALFTLSKGTALIGSAIDHASSPVHFREGISPLPSLKEADLVCSQTSGGIAIVREHRVNCEALLAEQRLALDALSLSSRTQSAE